MLPWIQGMIKRHYSKEILLQKYDNVKFCCSTLKQEYGNRIKFIKKQITMNHDDFWIFCKY